VKLAAVTVGVIVQVVTNDCEIVSTNRIPAEAGLFTLEVSATQSVQSSISDPTVLIPLVEVGFDVGLGGRAKFILLLQQQEAFADLQDVSVLDGTFTPSMTNEPTVSPSIGPTLAPTTSPTINTTSVLTSNPSSSPSDPLASSNPSTVDTMAPTTLPTVAVAASSSPTIQTDAPTLSLSISPSTSAPSLVSSVSPTADELVPSLSPSSIDEQVPSSSPQDSGSTLLPTSVPSGPPSAQPSKAQSATGAEVSPSSDDDIQLGPLLIAAIVGGSLAIFIFGCCLFWGCFWVGRRKRDEDEDDAERPINTSSSSQPNVLPVFPEMVQLNDDNQSLADTTLGEHTAGRKPPKKKRLVSLESFDDSSIYTSPYNILPSKRINGGRKDDEDDGSYRRSDSVHITSILAGGAADETSTLGAMSRGTSLDAEVVETTKHRSDSSSNFDHNLDIDMVDFGDDHPFFDGDGEGLLGAIAPRSPLAGKIEDMVAAELDYASSDSSNSSTSVMIGDTDSPLDLSNTRQGNIVIVEDAVSPGSSASSSAKKLDFDLFGGGQGCEVGSVGSRSSMTSKMGNITPSSNEGGKSIETDSSASPTATSPESANGGPKKAQMSPSAFLQTKLYQPRHTVQTKPAVYRSRFLGSTPVKGTTHYVPSSPTSESPETRGAGNSPFGSSKSSVASSPAPQSPHSDKLFDNADLEGKLISPRTPEDPPAANASAHATPDAATIAAAMIKTPAPVRRVSAADVFRSPVSMKTAKPKKVDRQPCRSVSPGHSSSSNSEDDNQFLFAAVERTLGPRSASADVESLSGRSGRSRNSSKNGRKSMGATDGSVGSRNSYTSRNSRASRTSRSASHISLASEEKNDVSFATPRTLQHDLERLEKQLAMLKSEAKKEKRAKKGEKKGIASTDPPTSALTISVGGSVVSHGERPPRMSAKQRVVVVVPPGKLGVVLANRRDGSGTFVADVKKTSALNGSLSPGDKLVAVDGVDVTGMVVAEITALMKEKSQQERHLTVVTSSKLQPLSQEAKYSSP
jgi:hypothetical protein